MRSQLRAELLKQRSTTTTSGLLAALVGLVLLAVALHALALPADAVDGASEQLMVVGRGEFLAAVFAGLLGALCITAEIRHGTIRPTLLVNPHRTGVLAAKVWASALAGAGFGLIAGIVAAGMTAGALAARGIELQLDGGDYALMLAGSPLAAGLWGAIGVGVGAAVRDQVPTLIGIAAWSLFVEGLLVGDLVGVGNIGRFAPGAAAEAITGQGPGSLLDPAPGVLVLALYAIAAVTLGARLFQRRDVA